VCDCSSDRHNIEEIQKGPQNWPQMPLSSARRENAPLAFGVHGLASPAGQPRPAANTRDILDTPKMAHASPLSGEECHDSSQPVSDPGACFSQFVRLQFASGGLSLPGEGGRPRLCSSLTHLHTLLSDRVSLLDDHGQHTGGLVPAVLLSGELCARGV